MIGKAGKEVRGAGRAVRRSRGVQHEALTRNRQLAATARKYGLGLTAHVIFQFFFQFLKRKHRLESTFFARFDYGKEEPIQRGC